MIRADKHAMPTDAVTFSDPILGRITLGWDNSTTRPRATLLKSGSSPPRRAPIIRLLAWLMN
jgi:hypothetical protein